MRKTSGNLIVFTGGGTGGHVYPGLAIIDELNSQGFFENHALCWMGSAGGMERRILQDREIPYISLPAGKLRRYFSFRNFIDVFKVAWAVLRSLVFMIRRRPALVFSKGGYVSVPPVVAARFCGIPVLTHESDFDPGLATRINARFADRICISYEKTARYFSDRHKHRLVVTGNPIRSAILHGDAEAGRRCFGLPGKKPLILVIGGSLGAVQVNTLITSVLDDLTPHAEILHQTGGGNANGIAAPGYVQREYIHGEMPDVLAAADIVVTRAGAGTLWECGSLGKAMILIPLDTAGSRGDQLRNASLFREAGAAEVLEGEAATAENLQNLILDLISSPQRRESLGSAARTLTGRNGAEECAALIRSVAASGVEVRDR